MSSRHSNKAIFLFTTLFIVIMIASGCISDSVNEQSEVTEGSCMISSIEATTPEKITSAEKISESKESEITEIVGADYTTPLSELTEAIVKITEAVYTTKEITASNSLEATTTVLTTEWSEATTEAVQTTTTTEKLKKPTSLAEKKSNLEKLYGIKIPDKKLDFKKLRSEKNPDIYAWIYIPNTKVDYPIVQHPTDNGYYLDYNYDGTKGYPGTIYSENYNKKDFSDRHTILYGHYMKSGAMFATLHYFENKNFFNNNKYIYIYTEDDIHVYRIFAAHEAPNLHLLLSYDWSQDKIFIDYLQGVLNDRAWNSYKTPGTRLTTKSKILTLSTCVGGGRNERYLVQGELLNAY